MLNRQLITIRQAIIKIRKKDWWDIFAQLSMHFYMLKTQFWYKLFFAHIGQRAVLRNPILLTNPRYISIGSRTLIRDGARLEALVRPGEVAPQLLIGSNVTIEQDFHVACCGHISIGDSVAIAARCAVVDVSHAYWESSAQHRIAGALVKGTHSVTIGKHVFLGIGVTVLPNVSIGEGAVIAAHSVVTSDIPAFAIAVGAPAKVTRFWNSKASFETGQEL